MQATGQREGVEDEAEVSKWEDSSVPDRSELSLGPVRWSPKALLAPFHQVVRLKKACNCLESNASLWGDVGEDLNLG